MPTYVFEYSQGQDIRWYASEVMATHGSKAEAVKAVQANKRVTFENGRWIEWLETETTFGVCYALATYWIICKAKGEDFLAWLKPGSRACPQVGNALNPGVGAVVTDVKAMQFSQHGKEPVFKLCDAMERVRAQTGLVTRDSTVVKTGEVKDKVGLSLIIIAGERQRGTGAQDLGGQGGFNHAIATYVIDKGNVLLFDPNRGEIKLSCVAELNQFIHYLCTNPNQYNLKSYTLRWSAVAANRIKHGAFA